jgi:hypothetical protein
MTGRNDHHTRREHTLLLLGRRQFLKKVGLVSAGLAVADPLVFPFGPRGEAQETGAATAGMTQTEEEKRASDSVTPPGEIPRRPLGRTGVEVSALALGGYHVGSATSEQEAIRIVQEAIDAGQLDQS